MKIRRRLPDGSFGELEQVFPPTADPLLVAAFEAIAMQNEMFVAQQAEMELMKEEIKILKGGVE
ncbi:hypothetical protein [Psychrobacillus psychrodurans]|uniref:Uncharacterized protein n=1 Tax=Psychrobacillus psychrodurans TaxID=126157 RepID=A0A9X3RCK7_9BACI|nr:hypothetical protein [Psychrobacillus psychrodurans]MCZ8535488.1 hypothetical protein [Psychrobacillus psychrodurans]